jgi:polyketide cyclase/dehydrase/lipid transport protein
MTTSPPAQPSAVRAITFGSLTAIAIGLFGFVLLHFQWAVYGVVVFLAVPIAAGFVARRIAGPGRNTLITLGISLVLGLGILITTGLEGWVCILMALPLILSGLLIGIGLAILLSKSPNNSSSSTTALLVGIPLLLFSSGWVEKSIAPKQRLEVISTSVVLHATPEKLFDMLKDVETVDAHRPFLMRIGLPVPIKCRLERGSVGAARTCYFDHGYIREEVVAWEPPNLMKMRVVENHVPGRHWLGFKDAIYEFHGNADGTTTVTRTTSITTALYPAIYWRPLERLGVETEHQYIFEDLGRRLASK